MSQWRHRDLSNGAYLLLAVIKHVLELGILLKHLFIEPLRNLLPVLLQDWCSALYELLLGFRQWTGIGQRSTWCRAIALSDGHAGRG